MTDRLINKRKLSLLLFVPVAITVVCISHNVPDLKRSGLAWESARISHAEQKYATKIGKSVEQIKTSQHAQWEKDFPACVERVRHDPSRVTVGMFTLTAEQEIDIVCSFKSAVLAIPESSLGSYWSGFLGVVKLNSGFSASLLLSALISLLVVYALPRFLRWIPKAYRNLLRWLYS